MLESLSNKVAGLRSCNFVKKRFLHRCFPVKITKFLRAAFITEHLRWLFLSLIKAKRYRNSVNWLRSIVFTVNFERIPQFLLPYSQLILSKRRLDSEHVCFFPAKKSYLSYKRCYKSISFSTLSMYFVDWFNFANIKTIVLTFNRNSRD